MLFVSVQNSFRSKASSMHTHIEGSGRHPWPNHFKTIVLKKFISMCVISKIINEFAVM